MRRDSPDYIVEVARNLRRNQTEAEQILWTRLRNRGLNGFKFRRQYAIGRYIADFYCSEANLVIEVDGEVHEQQKESDLYRETEIKLREVKILRVSNHEVLNNLETTIQKIIQTLS